MGMQQQTVSTGQALDNLTYDLIAVIHEKSHGLEAYEKYLQDAQSDPQCRQLFEQIRQQDTQFVQQLFQTLMQHSGSR